MQDDLSKRLLRVTVFAVSLLCLSCAKEDELEVVEHSGEYIDPPSASYRVGGAESDNHHTDLVDVSVRELDGIDYDGLYRVTLYRVTILIISINEEKETYSELEFIFDVSENPFEVIEPRTYYISEVKDNYEWVDDFNCNYESDNITNLDRDFVNYYIEDVTGAQSALTITEFTSSKVEGTFQLSYSTPNRYHYDNRDYSIFITNGKFSTQILNIDLGNR